LVDCVRISQFTRLTTQHANLELQTLSSLQELTMNIRGWVGGTGASYMGYHGVRFLPGCRKYWKKACWGFHQSGESSDRL